jgi:DNA adenine methylase
MEKFGGLGLMHRPIINGQARILETWIAPCDLDLNGTTVKKGTWLLAVRVIDDELWDAVKAGKFTGFSIGGSARRIAARANN